jgi:hypothetical protein
MTTRSLSALEWCVYISILAIVTLSFFIKPSIQLTLSYVSQTNQLGGAVAFFTVSNAGNNTVTCQRDGTLEIQGQRPGEKVKCTLGEWDLPPGQVQTAEVNLPGEMEQPWRFTIYYQTGGGRAPNLTTSDWITSPPLTTTNRVAPTGSRPFRRLPTGGLGILRFFAATAF